MPTPHHWLVHVLRDEPKRGGANLALDPEMPIAEAWARALEVCDLSAGELAARAARHFGLRLAELPSSTPYAIKLLPEKVARRHGVVPLEQTDGHLLVATSDPSDYRAEDDIAFASGRKPKFVIATPQAIADAIAAWYGGDRTDFAVELEDELANAVELVQDMGPAAVDMEEVEAAPVVRLTNIILRDAVRTGASDVHLEPGRQEGTVRFRVDGEIRDTETAQVALQASMTGHLVLATLHTNDAAGAVALLLDLGADRAGLTTALRGVLAQRLVRRVCANCSAAIAGDLTEAEHKLAARFATRPVVRSIGCAECGRTGYAGRIPVQEVLVVSTALSDRIAAGATATEIHRAAVASGMRTMMGNALERVKAGATTLEEVERVLGDVTGETLETKKDPPAGAAETVAGEASVVRIARPAAPAAGSAVSAARTPHILIVDDDPVHRGIARKILEKDGFEVDEAGSGAVALERVRETVVDLVVTDLSMPGLDGREVVAYLRAVPKTARLPILVATSQGDEELEVELMEAGADDYIRKPIEPGRFVARIRAALRRAAA